jgi:hypothetical protein
MQASTSLSIKIRNGGASLPQTLHPRDLRLALVEPGRGVAVDWDRIQPAKAGGFTIQVSWVQDRARDRLQVVVVFCCVPYQKPVMQLPVQARAVCARDADIDIWKGEEVRWDDTAGP